jgi:hypothetical protein
MSRPRQRETITSTVSHSDQPANLYRLYAVFELAHKELVTRRTANLETVPVVGERTMQLQTSE